MFWQPKELVYDLLLWKVSFATKRGFQQTMRGKCRYDGNFKV